MNKILKNRTKYFVALFLALFTITAIPSLVAADDNITTTVSYIRVYQSSGCIYTGNGDTLKVNLTTDAGRSIFSLALAAFLSGQDIRYRRTAEDEEGGCYAGQTTDYFAHFAIE